MLVDSIGEHVYTVSTLKVIPVSLRLWRSRTVVISIPFFPVLVHWPSNWIAVSSVLLFFFLFSFFGFPIQSTPIYSLALPNIHDPKSPCAIVCAQGSKRIGSSWALPLFSFFSFSFFCIHTHVELHLRRFSWALISISLLSAPLSLFSAGPLVHLCHDRLKGFRLFIYLFFFYFRNGLEYLRNGNTINWSSCSLFINSESLDLSSRHPQ